jgi:hypothetical protein
MSDEALFSDIDDVWEGDDIDTGDESTSQDLPACNPLPGPPPPKDRPPDYPADKYLPPALAVSSPLILGEAPQMRFPNSSAALPNRSALNPETNHADSVAARFRGILGNDICQNELISLRQGLFKDILPPLTRDEKRTKTSHLMTFESHRSEVLAVLETPVGITQVIEAAFRNRKNGRTLEALKMHIFHVH